MRCAKCGLENPDRAKFCEECAAPFPRRCPSCNTENSLSAKFCIGCAKPLEEETTPTGPSVAARQERDGERRHIAVLFCDLVNSTEIAAHLDPEEWRDIAADYQRTAAEAVKRLGGHVAKYLGDGLLAFFGWPEAHEDDGERAVRAGLAIVESVANLNQNFAGKLSVRVGIHAGWVVIGTGGGTEADVFGETPNVASRVQTLAEPDTVFITASVHQLISGLFVVDDRGAQSVKGIDEPIQLYRAIQPSAVRRRAHCMAARAATSFVGRDDEMRLLLGRWERAREGEGQVALVVGEPGIGKSRLVQEFRARIKDEPHLWIESAGEQFFASTPFHAVRRILDQGLGWRGDESKEERANQLERSLDLAGLKLTEAMPLIAEMLNLPIPQGYSPLTFAPDQKRKRLMANLAAWILNAARIQPVLMAVEDLQWVDASTLELIHTLVDQSATVPLMLLSTVRPEFRSPWPVRAHHAQITLTRLNGRDTRRMVANIAATSLTADIIDAVVKRTDGVPLFAEELTRLMLEGDDRTALREIPATLQNSLMARLDRLGPGKEVAQLAAVLGREFSYQLLEAISPLQGPDLQAVLSSIADAELIYPRGVPPEATYLFKHALVRDAAYETLLKSKRKELHHRVAVTIAERFPATAETEPEVLARHWTLASETTAAIASWRKAGDLAISHRAYVEAREPYQQALTMLSTLRESSERDAQELYLISAFADVLYVTKGYTAPDFADATRRARILAEKTGNLVQLVHRLHGTWSNVQVAGDYAAAAALADQVLDLAERERGGASLGLGYAAQIATRYWRGDLLGVEEYFARGKAFLDDPSLRLVPGMASLALGYASLNAWTMGMAALARERIKQATAAAQANSDPYELAVVKHMAAQLYLCLREPSLAETFAKQSLALSDEHGFTLYKCFSPICLGRAYQLLGREAEGIALIRHGLQMMAELGARRGICRYLTYLAEAQAFGGMVCAAVDTVGEAFRANPQELAHQPETLRVRGDLQLQNGQTQSAESDYLDSISLAKKMSAKTWELRAVTSLARMLRDTNRRDEARAMLSEIYNWFTEGFDTADLNDAKALLEELSVTDRR